MSTGFFWDEKCFWHGGGDFAFTLPLGGLVQPMSTGGLPENPETKRRLKNLMDVTGLLSELDTGSHSEASIEDLLRVHPREFLEKFKTLSDKNGGTIGLNIPFSKGGFEIASLSAGLAKGAVFSVLKGINQNLIPPLNAGWHKRRKSDHFTQYNKVVDEFSQFTDIDPWLINPYFEKLDNLNFQERKGENELASIASNMLKNINKKYKQYNIAQEAYLVVKANAGTYGMGIMIIKNSEDILNLNRKMRKKMSVIKGGAIVTEVIIQEGIHTEESIDESVAEPVIYMIDRFVVGGFFRVHTNKEKDENLNSPGMHFIPQPFETSCIMPDQGRPCDDEANRFYAYGVIARLALIAAARELQE